MSQLFHLKERKRLLQMHFESGVGHIGGNLSCLDFLLVLFNNFLRIQDKFVLSKGHSAGALYIALWSKGVLSEDDLKTFHQDDTLLPGHPPCQGVSEIEFGTGSLGHGLSLASGLALSAKIKNTDAEVFCLTSDGEWQEGSIWEALIFSIHHKLDNLTIVVDQNGLQGFGKTEEVASMSNLNEKLSGFSVNVFEVDGHDTKSIEKSLASASTSKPKVIILNTIKGKGVSFLENRMDSHYLPLNATQFQLAIEDLDKNER